MNFMSPLSAIVRVQTPPPYVSKSQNFIENHPIILIKKYYVNKCQHSADPLPLISNCQHWAEPSHADVIDDSSLPRDPSHLLGGGW